MVLAGTGAIDGCRFEEFALAIAPGEGGDAGKSRYAVATLMDISFGAATHRLDARKKPGGVNRVRQPLG